MIHGTDERRRGQHTDTRNLLEPLRDGMLRRHARELAIDRGDPCLERADFIDNEREGLSKQVRKREISVLEDARHASEHRASAHWDRQPLFA